MIEGSTLDMYLDASQDQSLPISSHTFDHPIHTPFDLFQSDTEPITPPHRATKSNKTKLPVISTHNQPEQQQLQTTNDAVKQLITQALNDLKKEHANHNNASNKELQSPTRMRPLLSPLRSNHVDEMLPTVEGFTIKGSEVHPAEYVKQYHTSVKAPIRVKVTSKSITDNARLYYILLAIHEGMTSNPKAMEYIDLTGRQELELLSTSSLREVLLKNFNVQLTTPEIELVMRSFDPEGVGVSLVSILGRADNCVFIKKKLASEYTKVEKKTTPLKPIHYNNISGVKSRVVQAIRRSSTQTNNNLSSTDNHNSVLMESIVLKLGKVASNVINSKKQKSLTEALRVSRSEFHRILSAVDTKPPILTRRDCNYLEQKYFLIEGRCVDLLQFRHDFILLGKETIQSLKNEELVKQFKKRMSVAAIDAINTSLDSAPSSSVKVIPKKPKQSRMRKSRNEALNIITDEEKLPRVEVVSDPELILLPEAQLDIKDNVIDSNISFQPESDRDVLPNDVIEEERVDSRYSRYTRSSYSGSSSGSSSDDEALDGI